MTTGSAILSVAVGLTAGAALGFIFAYEYRSDAQRKIVKQGAARADDLNERINEKFNELIEAATGKVGEVKSATAPFLNKELVGKN